MSQGRDFLAPSSRSDGKHHTLTSTVPVTYPPFFQPALLRQMPLTTVEISKKALKHNRRQQLKAILPPEFTLIAVIKANAYGHEMSGVAETIKGEVSYMAVSTVEDGLALRKSGIHHKLLVMGNVDYRDKSLLLEAVEKELELSVYNLKNC